MFEDGGLEDTELDRCYVVIQIIGIKLNYNFMVL